MFHYNISHWRPTWKSACISAGSCLIMQKQLFYCYYAWWIHFYFKISRQYSLSLDFFWCIHHTKWVFYQEATTNLNLTFMFPGEILTYPYFSRVCVTHSVAQLCPTVCDSADCSLPVSTVHGIFLAGTLKWVSFTT